MLHHHASGRKISDILISFCHGSLERHDLNSQSGSSSGLDGCEQFVDVNDMIRDEDLLGHSTSVGNGQASSGDFRQSFVNKQEVHELVANMVPGGLSRTLSARERNMLKRKAKVLPKDGMKEWGEDEDIEQPLCKRTKQGKSAAIEQLSGGAEKVC